MRPIPPAKLHDLKAQAILLCKEYLELGYRPREVRAMFQMAECAASELWDETEEVLTDEAFERDNDMVAGFYAKDAIGTARPHKTVPLPSQVPDDREVRHIIRRGPEKDAKPKVPP